MIRLTLAQMRRSLGRLVAAGLAIALGTGFVTASLLAGEAMTLTARDAVTTQYADADLVLGGRLDGAAATAVGSVPGVGTVHRDLRAGAEAAGPRGSAWITLAAPAADPALEASEISEGTLPGAGEIALDAAVAERLGLEVGSTVRLTLWSWADDTERVVEPTVSGLVRSAGAFALTSQAALVPAGELADVLSFVDPDEGDVAWSALVATDGTRGVEEVRADLRAALGQDVTVRTLTEQADATVADITGSTQVLTAVVLGFAAVALLVAALVIANTFQVIVAQRTRTLALLRCIGADRRQLRRSVLTEAALLGLAASAAGVLLATGLVQALLAVLGRALPDVPLPAAVLPGATTVLVPLLVGTLVTAAAALVPARAATRVAPLAALRPTPTGAASRRAGRVRAVLSAVLVAGGALGLVGGVVLTAQVDVLLGLAVGILGGSASFVGVVVGAVFWVPRLLRAVSRLTDRAAGPAARLASANAVRNPRRTAATSAALLIGVTLVSMMSAGAAAARAALESELDGQYPVDIQVQAFVGAGIPAGLPADVAATDGVETVVELTSTTALVRVPGQEYDDHELVAADPDRLPLVVRDRTAEELADDVALVPEVWGAWHGVQDGDPVTVVGADGREHTFRAVLAGFTSYGPVVLTTDRLAEVDPGAAVSALWIGLSDAGAGDRVVPVVADLASATDAGLSVSGAAAERAFFNRVVDSLLAVVVGLLGVSVVIAVVGVANTLALSVIERRRESATLRAVGMSRRQLRSSLAVEGLLIAGAGGLVGVVLGTLYGWVGARTLLGEIVPVGLVVPWPAVAATVAVALGAGLLASVLPARRAVRTPPVAALAVE